MIRFKHLITSLVILMIFGSSISWAFELNAHLPKDVDSTNVENQENISQRQQLNIDSTSNKLNDSDIKEINRISNLIIKFNNLNKNQIKNIIKKSFQNVGFVKGINAIDNARILFVPYCDLKNETIAKAHDTLNDTSNFYKFINFDTLPGSIKRNSTLH